MSSHKEQRSGRSGRSRLIRTANRTVQSVPPSTADTPRNSKFRSLGPSTPRRPVQPSVCGVQPGKVLELRTTLGLLRARAILDQQIEQERQVQQQQTDRGLRGGGGGGDHKIPMTSGRLKHGRLQPLSVVSDPSLVSNSCLGIVSVGGQPQNNQRARSSTVPGVHVGNQLPAHRDQHHKRDSTNRIKGKGRSYSAVLQGSVPVNRLKELTADLSITQHTGFIPEEGPVTNKHTRTINIDNRNQRQTLDSQTNALHGVEKVQNSNKIRNESQTNDTNGTNGDAQMLPPVVRHGESGMKVEVKRLKATRDSVSEMNQGQPTVTPSNVGNIVQSTEMNHSKDQSLPQLGTKEKPTANSALHFLSQPTPIKVETSILKEEGDGQKNRSISSHDSGSKSTPSSPRRVNIVSLGEVPTARPRSQQTSRHQQRRRRRHSEGRPIGGGRLSRGWSPPQTIDEPLVGSPLHTPRKQSNNEATNNLMENSRKVTKVVGNKGQSTNELETTRSLMTSPGLMINIDVNEFLQDIPADDPV